eukprot:GHVT01102276.1.p1 GENE.GHVT01102276.1~~GHVT01102276.1.p1  ORF type:complete len:141 (-),score=20.60 GHVT01102276.1:148-570(-)
MVFPVCTPLGRGSQILASDLTYGYTFKNARLLRLNGSPVRNLKHLKRQVEGSRADFLDFEFEKNLRIVLDRRQAEKATVPLLKIHHIPAAWSDNVAGDQKPADESNQDGPASAPRRNGKEEAEDRRHQATEKATRTSQTR